MVKDQKKSEVIQSKQSTEKKTQKKSTRGKHPMPAIMRVSCTVLFLIVMAIFFTWFIFWRQNMCDGDTTWDFVQNNPGVVTYSYLVVLALMAVITAITWRPFFSTGLFFVIISIITFINMEKFRLRAAPLLPEEFMLAESVGNMTDFIDMAGVWRLVFGVIFVITGSVMAEFYVRKLVGRDLKRLPWWSRTALVPRVTFTMAGLAMLGGICRPVIHREDYAWIDGIDLVDWSQTENYEKNGFVIGFLYNLGGASAEEPEGYSERHILAIADKYRAEKAADTSRLPWGEEIDNLIIILNETFYDPSLLTEYYAHTGGDVTPNLHKIFRNYPSGYMYSTVYGGGTANVEFEVQTGLSNYWAMTTPYVNILPKLESLISPAQAGEIYDFSARGIHSYDKTMYKRHLAYRTMGYDELIGESEFTHTEKEAKSSVLNDRAIYQEVLDLLKDSDEPQVISTITMQNHAPYAQAGYETLDFQLLQREGDWWLIEHSFQSLHSSDEYLGEFIKELDELDERTVVLWFGDHAMGTLDKYTQSEDKLDRDLAHITPYFVYANFEIESPYTTQEVAKMNKKQGLEFSTRDVDLPTTTPNCLLNTTYNLLNLEKPALFYLLDEVCTSTPILTQAYENGNRFKPTEALVEYELVNYDILYGEQYWDGM